MRNLPDETTGSQLILVVEDDPQMRRFLRATLTTSGYKLLEASTAQDGIRQASVQHPDLIILDLGLPDMDGLDVMRQLREWSSTPIIKGVHLNTLRLIYDLWGIPALTVTDGTHSLTLAGLSSV